MLSLSFFLLVNLTLLLQYNYVNTNHYYISPPPKAQYVLATAKMMIVNYSAASSTRIN